MAGCERTDALSMTRVIIVDDHEMVRRGLMRLLSEQPNLTVCASLESAELTLDYLKDQTADLAIVDISLGHMDGLQLTRRICRDHPHVRVLILSMRDPMVYAEQARCAGASGFVAKATAGDTLLAAIEQVRTGGTYFNGATVASLQR